MKIQDFLYSEYDLDQSQNVITSPFCQAQPTQNFTKIHLLFFIYFNHKVKVIENVLKIGPWNFVLYPINDSDLSQNVITSFGG